jgi:hypothetical protein
MSIAILLMAGFLSVLLGRFLFGNWFNHVSLYGSIWSISLSLFQARLIWYYPLAPETWMLIGAAWFAFIVGSITVVAFQRFVGSDHKEKEGVVIQQDRESNVLQNRFLPPDALDTQWHHPPGCSAALVHCSEVLWVCPECVCLGEPGVSGQGA